MYGNIYARRHVCMSNITHTPTCISIYISIYIHTRISVCVYVEGLIKRISVHRVYMARVCVCMRVRVRGGVYMCAHTPRFAGAYF